MTTPERSHEERRRRSAEDVVTTPERGHEEATPEKSGGGSAAQAGVDARGALRFPFN